MAAVAALVLAGSAGCFGADHAPAGGVKARTVSSKIEGSVKVERIVYTTFDGTRVPALLAIPRATPPRGCLVWENGLGSRKEDSSSVWPGAAGLGLATFSIDFRYHGERAENPDELERVLRRPARVADLVRGSVSDLARGLDYLDSRPECRHNLGYAGLSLGGMIGTVLSGRDRRVRASVIMSTPPSWRALLRRTDLILPGIEKKPGLLRAALQMLSPLDPERWIGKIAPRPVMVMIGRRDQLVPPAAAREVEAAARDPKLVINYNGGHIPLTGKASARNAGRIGSFLLRYLVRPTYR